MQIRAFYAVEMILVLNQYCSHPGYNNLIIGEIITKQNNDGLSDSNIPSSQYGFGDNANFKEYTFTADKLPSFRYYRIKLLLTSTSQVFVPKVKDLRVMALA